MTLELSQQSLAWLFLWAFIMGLSAGFIYDAFKFRRKLIRFGKIFETILMSLEDVCFFLLWSVAFCILLYAINNGVVRTEAIFFQLIGFGVYRKTLGIPIGKLSDLLTRFVRDWFSKLVMPIKKHKIRKIRKRKEHRTNEWSR